MSDELRIPIVEEAAHLSKRAVDTERVTVRTSTEERQVLVHDQVQREHVEITRVPRDEEVAAAPPIRTEGDLTIIPVIEERVIVEKRLFLIEELHLRRTVRAEDIELPATLRRTRVEIDREDLNPTGEY